MSPTPEPTTHADTPPAELVGRLVKVRPYYRVPSSPWSLESTLSPYAFPAVIVEAFGDDIVLVRYTWESAVAPWAREQVFYPHELHDVHACRCEPCHGRFAQRGERS